MANWLGGMSRKHSKKQFEKMASGQDLVSDQEKQKMENATRQVVQTGTEAQTQNLNRAGMANAMGAPVMSGAITDAAKESAKQGADAATKAMGLSADFAEKTAQARKAEIYQRADTTIARNDAIRKEATDAAMFMEDGIKKAFGVFGLGG